MINPKINIWKHSEEYLERGITVIPNFLTLYYLEHIQEVISSKNEEWIHVLENLEIGLKEYTGQRIEQEQKQYEEDIYRVKSSLYYDQLSYSYHKLEGVSQDSLRVFNTRDFAKFISFISSHTVSHLSHLNILKYQFGDFGYSYGPRYKDHKVNFIYNLTKDWKLDYGGIMLLHDGNHQDIHLLEDHHPNSIIIYDKERFVNKCRMITPVTVSKTINCKYLIVGGL